MKPRLHILIADLDYETRDYLQDLLHQRGHDVGSVGTASLLPKLCQDLEPDVVIAGTGMGSPDVSEAAVQINRERPVPFILVGDGDERNRLVRRDAACVVDYLAKPLKAAEIEEALLLAVRWLQGPNSERTRA
jgi:DNA-binding response OmpR family regulator